MGYEQPVLLKEIDALCFGFGPQLYVRLEADGDALQAIWFDIDTTQPKELAALRRAFESIDKVVPSLIADYWLNSSGLLEDRSFLDAYFDHFENPASENHQIDLAHAPSENRGIWRVLTRIFAGFRL